MGYVNNKNGVEMGHVCGIARRRGKQLKFIRAAGGGADAVPVGEWENRERTVPGSVITSVRNLTGRLNRMLYEMERAEVRVQRKHVDEPNQNRSKFNSSARKMDCRRNQTLSKYKSIHGIYRSETAVS